MTSQSSQRRLQCSHACIHNLRGQRKSLGVVEPSRVSGALLLVALVMALGPAARAATPTTERRVERWAEPLDWPGSRLDLGLWALASLGELPSGGEGTPHGWIWDQPDPVPLFPPVELTSSSGEPGSDPACAALLWAEGVAFEPIGSTEGIATPVRPLSDVIGGIAYRYYYQGTKPWVFDCRLALALARAAPVLRANGVTEVIFASHYRPSFGTLPPGQVHRHAQGLAIDIKGFRVGGEHLVDVARDYEPGLGFMVSDSCLGQPMTARGLLLRKLVCDLDEADIFESILTPDYDQGHWNHFHFSVMHPQNRSGARSRGTALLEVPLTDLPLWAQARPPLHEPELRRWDGVAAKPWPSAHETLRQSFGIPAGPEPAEDAAALLGDVPLTQDLFARLAGAMGHLPRVLWKLLDGAPRT